MKVWIGGLAVEVETLEELDELVKRYGGDAAPAAAIGKPDNLRDAGGNGGQPVGGERGTRADIVILRKLVEAGSQGIPTSDLGEMLGRRGKATRGAAKEWAHRVGITSDPNHEAFDEIRVGTQRGLRIKGSLMDIAKAHLGS